VLSNLLSRIHEHKSCTGECMGSVQDLKWYVTYGQTVYRYSSPRPGWLTRMPYNVSTAECLCLLPLCLNNCPVSD
jgi:hypothetical protein